MRLCARTDGLFVNCTDAADGLYRMPVSKQQRMKGTSLIFVSDRTRKVKCFLGPIGQRCERCKSRDLRCSMVSLATSPGRGHGSSAPAIPRATPSSQTGTIAQPEAFPHPVLDEMPNTLYARFDIGNGTAAEILREGDLTRRLLVLYFDNFSDIHFMFDQETFLREFALGDVPKATLYTMMALGIR